MAQPIYKFWLAKPTEPWFALSEEEQNALIAKVNEALAQVGGKRPILCDSSWTSEQWPLCGVEEFPDIDAVQRFTEALNSFNWSRYHDSFTVLGTNLNLPTT